MKTIVYRLSGDGFSPHYQDYHAQGLEIGLKHYQENPNNYPEHLRNSISNSYAQVIPEWKEFTTGVFAFVGSLPDSETIRILTNHLDKNQKESFVWSTAELDIHQFAFDANNLWRSKGFKKIEDLVKDQYYEVFIPEQFLKLSNIQSWSQDYRSIFHNTNENLLLPTNVFSTNNKKVKIR